MVAMLLSSVGDIFMVNADKIGQYSTYIGAGLFIAAHIIYGTGFYEDTKAKGKKIFNPSFYVGLALMIISVLWLGYEEFFVASEKKPIMFFLILIYISAIGYNVCSQFSYAGNEKGASMILPPAIIVFYITDIFIFLNMLNINNGLRQYVWFAYPVAQLAIILFNGKFEKKKAYQIL